MILPSDFPLAGQNDNSYKQLWMLGLALILPMMLLAGPLAGYAIGFWLIRHFEMPGYTIPAAMILGFLGSALQAYQTIRRISNRQKEK